MAAFFFIQVWRECIEMCKNWLPEGTVPAKGAGGSDNSHRGLFFPQGFQLLFQRQCLHAAVGQICGGFGYFSVDLGVVSPNPSLPSSLCAFLPSWRRCIFRSTSGTGCLSLGSTTWGSKLLRRQGAVCISKDTRPGQRLVKALARGEGIELSSR